MLIYAIFLPSITILISATSIHSNPETKKVINVAGLFTPFNSSFGRDDVGIQSLSAFVMAIREINTRHDILPNHVLNFTVRTPLGFGDTVETVIDIQKDAFNRSGVEAFVVGLPFTATSALNNILKEKFRKLYITTVTGAVSLSPRDVGLYKVRTVPADAYNGMLLQDTVINAFGYKKVSIFYGYDETSLRTSIENGDKTYGEMMFLSSHAFQSKTEDFTEYINLAKAAGSQIFIIFTDGVIGARLLEQGYNQGLFREGTQIFGSELLTAGQPWKYMSKDADVPAIMKGYIGPIFDPSFHLQDSQEGKDFVSKFRSQKTTITVNSDGTETCDESKDDDGHYLYREQTHSGPGQRVRCAGMDFSSLKADGSDIAPHAPHAYDAVYLLAHGLHNLLEIQGQDKIDGGRLRKTIIDNVTFNGATGFIDIFEGMPDYDYYGAGDRETGHTFRLYNFNEEVYRQTSGMNGYVEIGHWNNEERTRLCDKSVSSNNCSPVTYRTADNQPAKDSPDDIIILMPAAMSVALYVIGAMIAILVIAVTIGVLKYKQTKIIKVSQPAMLFVILVGAMIGAGRVIAGGIPLSDEACMAEIWFIHLSFVLVCGSLFVKSWRVNALLNSTKIRKIKITTNNVLIKVGLSTTLMALYLMFITVFGGVRKVLTSTLAQNQITIRSHCTYKHAEMEMALYAMEGVVLGLGARLCWALKTLPSSFNESKHIASAITCLVSITALVIPLAYLLNLEPHISRFIIAMAYGVWITFTVVVMFGDKLYRASFGLGDKDDNNHNHSSAGESMDGSNTNNASQNHSNATNGILGRKSYASRVSVVCDDDNGAATPSASRNGRPSLLRAQSVGRLARQFVEQNILNKGSIDVSIPNTPTRKASAPAVNNTLVFSSKNTLGAVSENKTSHQNYANNMGDSIATKFGRQNSVKIKEVVKVNVTGSKSIALNPVEYNDGIISNMDENNRKDFIRKQISLWEEAMVGISE
eukprot:gene2384-4628_t